MFPTPSQDNLLEMALQMLDSTEFIEHHGVMIMLIVEHWVNEEDISAARAFLDKMAGEQAIQPGFVRRFTIQSLEDHRKLTTVTVWTAMSDYERWIHEVLPGLRGERGFSFIDHRSELSVIDDERLPAKNQGSLSGKGD